MATDGVVDAAAWAGPPPGEYVELATTYGPLALHLRETPALERTDRTAVHLHGLAGSSTNWTDLARMLGLRTRSVALDLPGFGHTEPPVGFDCTRTANTHVVVRYLEELGGEPVHLFGNSFGGAVAIEVAAERPDLVATLTLISPALPDFRPDPRRLSDQRMLWALLPLVGPRVRRGLARVSAQERADRLIRLCFAEPAAVPPDRVRAAVEEIEIRADLPWAGPALERTTERLLRSWLVPPSQSIGRLLGRVRAPTLVVWGLQDKVVSVRRAVPAAEKLDRGRLLMLPRTGHVAHMERPRTVARAAVAMFDGVPDSW
ncbi:alpha/beta fold hydrolase [Parasphingorhabdus pacifica]